MRPLRIFCPACLEVLLTADPLGVPAVRRGLRRRDDSLVIRGMTAFRSAWRDLAVRGITWEHDPAACGGEARLILADRALYGVRVADVSRPLPRRLVTLNGSLHVVGDFLRGATVTVNGQACALLPGGRVDFDPRGWSALVVEATNQHGTRSATLPVEHEVVKKRRRRALREVSA